MFEKSFFQISERKFRAYNFQNSVNIPIMKAIDICIEWNK